MWEQLEKESAKAYNAFRTYIELPIKSTNGLSRSVQSVQIKLGYKSKSTLDVWASKYNWVERAKAYDAHIAQNSLVLRQDEVEVYRQYIIDRRTAQLAVLDDAIEKELLALRNKEESSAMDILRLAKAMREIDDMARRLANLPTNLTTEKVPIDTGETYVYNIGGNNGEET